MISPLLIMIYADIFQMLFYGNGSWLGLLILVLLFVVLRAINKFTVIISFFVATYFGFQYLAANMGWEALMIWLASVVILLSAAKDIS